MKKDLLVEKQSKDYKNGTTKSRCVKLSIACKREDFDFILEHQRLFSRKISRNLNSIKLKRSSADHIFPDDVEKLVKEHGYTLSFIKRQLIRPVLERYISYKKRNRKKKFPNSPLAVKQKSIAIYDGCVVMDKVAKKIILRYHPKAANKAVLELPYSFLGTMGKKEEFISDKPGGQLVFNGNKALFTVRATMPLQWQYQPTDFVGFDCNQSKETFMVFSKDIELFGQTLCILKKTHPCLKRALSLENQLAILNKIKIKKNKIRTKIKLKHKHHERSYLVLVTEILNYFEKNKLGLAIDALSVGARTGSFGQDKIIKLLIREAENRGIPHVLVPTPYTTRLCSECGHLHETIPLSVRKFECSNCKVELLRDHNAAKNVEKRGAAIWELGMEEVDKAFKTKYDKSIFKNE